MRDFREEWMQRYFDYPSSGTVAEGSKLRIKVVPAVFECEECKNTFTADLRWITIIYPCCISVGTVRISRRDFLIESVGVFL